MLSNKLTFSLASLVFLLIVGMLMLPSLVDAAAPTFEFKSLSSPASGNTFLNGEKIVLTITVDATDNGPVQYTADTDTATATPPTITLELTADDADTNDVDESVEVVFMYKSLTVNTPNTTADLMFEYMVMGGVMDMDGITLEVVNAAEIDGGPQFTDSTTGTVLAAANGVIADLDATDDAALVAMFTGIRIDGTDVGTVMTSESTLPSGMVKTKEFAVITHMGAMIKDTGLSIGSQSVDGLPNLQTLFNGNGGTLELVGKTAAAAEKKGLIITEIMWGEDLSASMLHYSQWIEIYNASAASIELSDYKLKVTPYDGSTFVPDTMAVDTVGNLGDGKWSVPGQGGRSMAVIGTTTQVAQPAVPLISMRRKIDYAKATVPTEGDNKDKLVEVNDGTLVGSWEASTSPSFNIGVNRVASPGKKHQAQITAADKTVVPYSPVIINEIGNYPDGDKDHNWIELLAVADVNLKNYQLSYIVDGKQTELIHFNKDKDQNLVADDILLIVNKDPGKTMLARGKKFGDKDGVTPDEDQDNRGGVHEASMYYDAAGALDDLSKGKEGTDGAEKFLLVLRSEPKTNHEKIIDIAGTDFHAVASLSTHIAPLRATAAGHGNVIDGTDDEAFIPGKVYKRNDKTGGTGEKDWGTVGYTGIGYDREAPMEAQYGGTPGFPNDAQKSKPADIGADVVTISEIMVFSQAGQFPQWIELRNSSATLGVNLDNWKLRVENVGEVTARKSVTIDLPDGYRLPPNGTILIATRPGTASDELSDSRVINLYANLDTRRKIEAPGPRYTLLSLEGFTLKLFGDGQKDTDASPVDIVTIDADMLTEELIGNRSGRISLIRYYSGGTPGAFGTAEGSNQVSDLLSEQYYGHRNDTGTPGWYPGGALPVNLSSFRPARDKATGAVVIRWATESELDNAGFNILRSETKTGEFKVVNLKGIIPGHGTTSEKHTYEWKDTSAKPNVVYYYQIEDVSLDGNRTTLATTHLRGNVTAAGKATTRWGELKDSRY